MQHSVGILNITNSPLSQWTRCIVSWDNVDWTTLYLI